MVNRKPGLIVFIIVASLIVTVALGSFSSTGASILTTLAVCDSYGIFNLAQENATATIYLYKVDMGWTALRFNNDLGYHELTTNDGSTWNRILLNIVEDLSPQLAAELDAQDFPITDIDYLGFNLVNGRTPLEGEMAWNPDEGTLDIGMPGGVVVLQLGQEMLVRGRNTTGVQIDDGMAVRISGASGSKPEFGLADANDPAAAESIGLATEDIGDNQNGYVNTMGLVRDIDTSGTPVSETWNAADRLYVSNTPGELTNVAPTGSERIICIGIVLRAHATEGVIWVNPIEFPYLSELSGVTIAGEVDGEVLRYDNATDTWQNAAVIDDSHPPTATEAFSGEHTFDYLEHFNGTIFETIDVTVVESAGTVSLELQAEGGGDLTANFSTGHHLIDTTDPVASVALTNGDDEVPVKNWVYILESNDTLTASTVGWPDAEHAPIATVVVQSAASVASVGPYAVQAWVNHIKDENDQGHLTDISDWIRGQHATWKSGVAPTLTFDIGPTPDTVIFTSTSGEVYQLHPHDFPAFTGTPTIYVFNDNATPYNPITDLNQLTAISDGTALSNNDYFTVTIWAVVSEKAADCKLYLNLPSGVYGNTTSALLDSSMFTNTSIPAIYKGSAFLIARYTLRYQTAGSGTFSLVATGDVDLRGQPPGTLTGGGAGGGSSLTVEEQDGVPSVPDVNTIKFTNGTVTDDGGGIVSVSTAGGGGGAIITQFEGVQVDPTADTINMHGIATVDEGGNVSGLYAPTPVDDGLKLQVTYNESIKGWLNTGDERAGTLVVASGAGGPYEIIAHFEDGLGTNATDESGNANDGTLTNGPTWTGAGKYGSAVEYDGDDDFTTYGDIADFGTGAFSISCWMYNTGATNQGSGINAMLAKSDATTAPGFAFARSATAGAQPIRFYINTALLVSDAALNEDQWYHVAATRTGAGFTTLYVDGVAQVDTETDANDVDSADPFLIGSDSAGGIRNWEGRVDELQLFAGITLSADEVALIHSNQWRGDTYLDTANGSGIYIAENTDLSYVTAGSLEGATKHAFTIEMWILPGWDGDDGVAHTLLDLQTSGNDRVELVKTAADNLRFEITDAAGGESYVEFAVTSGNFPASASPDDPGIQVVATKVGAALELYINGASVDDTEAGGGTGLLTEFANDEVLNIGRSDGNTNELNGIVDTLRIYNRALSAEEVAQNFYATREGVK